MTRCLLRMFTETALAHRSSYLKATGLLTLFSLPEREAKRMHDKCRITHHPCSSLPFGLRWDTTARIFLRCTTGVSLALDQVSESVSFLGEDLASIATLASSVARMRSCTTSMAAGTVCDILDDNQIRIQGAPSCFRQVSAPTRKEREAGESKLVWQSCACLQVTG